MNTIIKTLFATSALMMATAPALASDHHYREQKSEYVNSPVKDQYISQEQARDIALQRVGGGVVKERDVDFEHSRRYGTYYEVEVHKDNMEYEVKVDAKSGKVLSVKKEID